MYILKKHYSINFQGTNKVRNFQLFLIILYRNKSNINSYTFTEVLKNIYMTKQNTPCIFKFRMKAESIVPNSNFVIRMLIKVIYILIKSKICFAQLWTPFSYKNSMSHSLQVNNSTWRGLLLLFLFMQPIPVEQTKRDILR